MTDQLLPYRREAAITDSAMTSDESNAPDEPEEIEDEDHEEDYEEEEDPVNPEDVLLEGEELGSNAPGWLRELISKRDELIDECERLEVDPHEVLTSCKELRDPFEYLESLGADVRCNSFDGAAPGGGGWYRRVILPKAQIPAAIKAGEEELREATRRMRLLYLQGKGFADLETEDLEAVVDKIGPLDEAARTAEERKVRTLREELEEAQCQIAKLEEALEEVREEKREARETAGSDDLAVSRETWRRLGLWPIGPLAWLEDGSVAYLHNFLDGCLSQHAFWYGVVEDLHAAGVKVRGLDCKNSRILAHSPASGISYGYRVSLDETKGAGLSWNHAWRFALSEGEHTRISLPSELGWLRDRLQDQLGIKATLTPKA